MHEVTGKNGKIRATTLRDARELGLYPSVSTILKVISKPGLEAWKQEQAILAALTLPKREGEPLDAFAKRVVEDMEQQGEKAREWGTTLHSAIEDFIHGIETSSETLIPWMKYWGEYAKENEIKPIKSEGVITHSRGFAGRFDLYCWYRGEKVIMDFKTQTCLAGGKLKFYDEWPLQLSAYQQGMMEAGHHVDGIVSVVIDATQANPFVDQAWENTADYWPTFLACLQLWIYEKGFNPCATISKKSAQKAA